MPHWIPPQGNEQGGVQEHRLGMLGRLLTLLNQGLVLSDVFPRHLPMSFYVNNSNSLSH